MLYIHLEIYIDKDDYLHRERRIVYFLKDEVHKEMNNQGDQFEEHLFHHILLHDLQISFFNNIQFTKSYNFNPTLDRIDNKLGHILDNIKISCVSCN
jgi:uncharacterized protein (DUF1919 family)